jgi:hypothetical protein
MVRTRRWLRSPNWTRGFSLFPRLVWKSGANDRAPEMEEAPKGSKPVAERRGQFCEVSLSYPLNRKPGPFRGDRIFGNFDHGRGVSLIKENAVRLWKALCEIGHRLIRRKVAAKPQLGSTALFPNPIQWFQGR